MRLHRPKMWTFLKYPHFIPVLSFISNPFSLFFPSFLYSIFYIFSFSFTHNFLLPSFIHSFPHSFINSFFFNSQNQVYAHMRRVSKRIFLTLLLKVGTTLKPCQRIKHHILLHFIRGKHFSLSWVIKCHLKLQRQIWDTWKQKWGEGGNLHMRLV